MVLYLKLQKDVEEQLREQAMKQFGYAKGSIKEAVEEAIRVWLASQFTGIPPRSIEALSGMLKHVKASSVELKHAAVGLFAK